MRATRQAGSVFFAGALALSAAAAPAEAARRAAPQRPSPVSRLVVPLRFPTLPELTLGLTRPAELPALPAGLAAAPDPARAALLGGVPPAPSAQAARAIPQIRAAERSGTWAAQEGSPSSETRVEAAGATFDNARASREGAASTESAAAAVAAAPDDGGGPNYPYRLIRWLGEKFRATLFRPNVPVEVELVRAIDKATRTVHLALYEFKQQGVLGALRRARARGVEVKVLLDYSNVFPYAEPDAEWQPRRSNEIWALLREGFQVKVLRGFGEYGIMHNKLVLIDAETEDPLVFFGSYNLTWTAENAHYENAHFSVEKERAKKLLAYWKWLESQAVPEPQAEAHPWPLAPPPLAPELAPSLNDSLAVSLNGVKLPGLVFSPNRKPGQSTEDWLVKAIQASKKSIDAPIFALRSTRIAEALAAAHKSGKVAVRVLMDRGQADSDAFAAYAQWLAYQGVEVRTLAGPDDNSTYPRAQKTHHKVFLFDGLVVATGSPNPTKYGSISNFETAHFLADKKDVAGYAFVFEKMWARAKPFPRPAQAPILPTDAELTAETQQPPAPRPPLPPQPEPPNRPVSRTLSFRGETYDTVIMRPDKPVASQIVRMIGQAQKGDVVRLALYEFDLDEVLAALRQARARGAAVEIVIDYSHLYTRGRNSRGELRKPSAQIQALVREGFDMLVLKGERSGIMHSKFVLVQGKTDGLLLTGSYNLTRRSEDEHYENVAISNETGDLADYRADFDYMRGLADAVDEDKLEEVLSRTEDGDEALNAEDVPDPAERTSKRPPPPVSAGTPFTLNGEKFRRSYFSPQGGILDAWRRAIFAAEKSIKIAQFGFYSREIAEALATVLLTKQKTNPAFQIQLALDAGQSTLAKIDGVPVNQWLAARGLDVKIIAGPDRRRDPMYQKQHSKYLVIDDKFVLTGSFNLSDTAENYSFENATVLMDPADVAMYVWDFARLHLRGWKPRLPQSRPKTALRPEFF